VGFFLGMRHATDPDHVVAVTTIVTRQRGAAKAALTGMFWGIGHTLTILLVGSAIILFGVVIPARIGLSMEFSVGIMLIVLGAMNVVAFSRSNRAIADDATETDQTIHVHPHRHGNFVHSHAHSHGTVPVANHPDDESLNYLDRLFGKIGIYQQLRPLFIGIVHGLAGSAAVALLILSTIRNPRWAIAYLLIFGVGTVGGMMLITMSLASAFNLFGRRNLNFSRHLGFASGLISLAFGLFVAYQIGFGNGLFSAHPQWTPR
jgi:hypothetical protein